MRNRASSPYGNEEEREREPIGTFLRIHRVYANEKHYREFCSWSSFSLFLSFSLSALVDRRAAIHPDETQGRDFGLHSEHVRWPNASRILSEITHSRPKRCSGTTPAVRAFWPHARDYYFFAGWVASLACNPFAVSEREDCISACKRLSDSPKLILHLFISYLLYHDNIFYITDKFVYRGIYVAAKLIRLFIQSICIGNEALMRQYKSQFSW